jgi:hypothetical protein
MLIGGGAHTVLTTPHWFFTSLRGDACKLIEPYSIFWMVRRCSLCRFKDQAVTRGRGMEMEGWAINKISSLYYFHEH